jgi:hypothetical protein
MVDTKSLLAGNPKEDWLVNGRTGLLFDGGVVAPRGRAAAVLPTAQAVAVAFAAAGAAATPATAVVVNAGSAVAAGNMVIATETHALEHAGLTHGVSGLNIVGAGGFNATLAENLTTNRSGLALRVDGIGRRS